MGAVKPARPGAEISMTTKIALIGAGSIGRVHARNIQAHPGAELATVCDLNPESAGALCAEHGGTASNSLKEALELDPDGVIIASSTASHGQVAMACIESGKPFLCEKPLASDLHTARQIASHAEAVGVMAAIAFNRRFDAGYSGIHKAIRAGYIGQVEALLITSRTASPPSVEFTRTSGGLFGEKGAHFYDLARWITGEDPIELFAMGSALINPEFATIGEVDTAMISMRMPSGALCQFDFSWRTAYGQDERLEVNGSHGMLSTFQEPVGRYRRNTADGESQEGLMPTWYQRFAPTYQKELDLFVAAIRSGEASGLPSLSDGCEAQMIADAAKQSVATGKPIQLSDLV